MEIVITNDLGMKVHHPLDDSSIQFDCQYCAYLYKLNRESPCLLFDIITNLMLSGI